MSIGFDDGLEDLFGLLEIGTIADTDRDVDSDIAYFVIVDDGVGGDDGVRSDDSLVFGTDHLRIEDVDIGDSPFSALYFDEVTNLIWFECEDHDAGCEIAEGSLERKSDCQTCCTQYGDE